MVDFALSEEQKQIKGLVREFCEREQLEKRMAEDAAKAAAAKTEKSCELFRFWDEYRSGLMALDTPLEYATKEGEYA